MAHVGCKVRDRPERLGAAPSSLDVSSLVTVHSAVVLDNTRNTEEDLGPCGLPGKVILVTNQLSERSRTVPDDVLPRAKALGDPTRFRIFRYIFEAAQPVGVAELTSYMQLNHNAVRQHLETLVSAGLVAGSVEQRDRPGRPRLFYKASPEAGGLWATPGPYEQLAVLLAQILRTGDSPEEVGRRAGLARAAELSRREPSPDALVAIEEEMSRAGFRPLRRAVPGAIELVLGRCPFESAAIANAADVCRLHLGLAQGLTQGVGGLKVEDLVVKNPRKAGCRFVFKEA